MKQCRICKEYKARYAFNADPSTKDGLQSHCQRCSLIHMLVNSPNALRVIKIQNRIKNIGGD